MIHRTRQGSPPLGMPEPGRSVIQMGDIWVEFSGTAPTGSELAAHLHPPKSEAPPDAMELWEMMQAKGYLVDADRR